MACRARGFRFSLAVLSLLSPAELPAAQGDGVSLTATRGPSPGQVSLSWTGGAPTYRVHRWTAPQGLVTPAHQIGTTSGLTWADTPPAGALYFYEVVPTCTNNPYCSAGEFCDATGTCIAVLANGSACTDGTSCQSGYCDNGFCCSSGTCCANSGHCGSAAFPPLCTSASTCQGIRGDGFCNASFQCSTTVVQDDSGCSGLESQSCGNYPSVLCTSAQSQPSNQAALCATNCAADSGCDTAAHCELPSCVADLPAGGTCDAAGDCQSALCTDLTCCTSACGGVCQACNVAGSPGSCTPIPNGQDPASECGAVGCTGFYHGFSGDSCLRKADVSAAQAACSGSSACRTQAQECAAQTTAGPVTTTCHSNCQDPDLATCTGTTPGSCLNVNPGTQTCGTGICSRTVNQCQNGAPLTCTPGTPQTETCNNLDDNCDGVPDNGTFSDGYEPNPACGSARVLNTVGSDQNTAYSTMTVYPSGDFDYYAIPLTETDNFCGCGSFQFDEDYEIRVTLTVPLGAGSFEICMNTGSCTFPNGYCFEVAEGNTINLSQFLDGACPGQDNYTTYLSIRGDNPPGYECLPYTLSIFFDAGLCR
jgi:hypothetical protein